MKEFSDCKKAAKGGRATAKARYADGGGLDKTSNPDSGYWGGPPDPDVVAQDERIAQSIRDMEGKKK